MPASSTPPTLAMYRRLARLPGGRWLFSRAVCRRAPYFSTIRPTVAALEPGRCEVRFRNRRRVQNHIRTVHAIAMANACELAAGLASEATVPVGMRWIPRGMHIEYLRKAETDLRAVSRIDAGEWRHGFELPVAVDVVDEAGETVVRARIGMWITEKKR